MTNSHILLPLNYLWQFFLIVCDRRLLAPAAPNSMAKLSKEITKVILFDAIHIRGDLFGSGDMKEKLRAEVSHSVRVGNGSLKIMAIYADLS